MIELANEQLRIGLDEQTGRVASIRNLARDLELLDPAVSAAPWQVEVVGRDEPLTAFSSFAWRREDGAVELRWQAEHGLTVVARVELAAGEPNALFRVRVENRGDRPVDKVEFPRLFGVRGLADDPGRDVLVHSQGSGFLFRDPDHLFEAVAHPGPLHELPPTERGRAGIRFSPYPEGFSGSPMQLMTYYAEGRGGFYLATHDPGGAMKWLNFYKDAPTGRLAATFIHQSPDVSPGRGLEVPYPVVVGALVEGSWYEAADRYKRWAVRQRWTRQGRLVDRSDRAAWLDQAGIATFGINAAHDRSRWLGWFGTAVGQPVFHILGPNWPNFGQNYGGAKPRCRDDWFPATFHPANLAAIRAAGDRWAPFEFDLFSGEDPASPEPVAASRLVLAESRHSFDAYRFAFMCPATDYWHDLHVWRDRRLVEEYDVDAHYYDICVNNVLVECRATGHGHPPGGGAPIVDAYRRMFADTRAAAAEAKGGPVPIGAETISELFIPLFDYYQARAEASPLSSFEADFFRGWIKSGQAEKIPLFAYVYHEYGPTRLDGWGKLAREQGDLFYWVAGRVALWGGLFELNYEFSPLETLDGHDETDPGEHYYAWEPRAYAIDPDKVAFLREIAAARTGYARDYLVHGTMLRPLPFATPRVELDYFLYNCFTRLPHYQERGVQAVPAVLHAAWRFGEKVGLLFANVSAEPQAVDVTLDPAALGLTAADPAVVRVDREGARRLAPIDGQPGYRLDLEPRRVAMLELRPA